MKVYILYHGNCPDGFGAAWAAWKTLGDQAEYIPVQHDLPLPDLEEQSSVYIVDFSYPADVLARLGEVMHQVVVLDHHKTAQQDLSRLPGLAEVMQGNSNVGVKFDMEKSGAVLAWEFFHPDQPVPKLLLYVQDKDLWQFHLPESRAVGAALAAHPKEFEVWDSLEIEQLKREGQIALCMRNRLVDQICQRVHWKEVGEYRVPVVNTPILASEVGNELCIRFPEAPFVACYSDLDNDKRKWELRSVGDFDVGDLAKKLGGGGHKNASGFTEYLKSD